MATAKQQLGELGEILVAKNCNCPKCKRSGTFKRLPTNFKCADIICDFCGYLAQVKASKKSVITELPKTILGAAWGVQKDRMDSGIYFPLYIVLINDQNEFSIYFLSADLQSPSMFRPRKPLSKNAKRSVWQGFVYDISEVPNGAIVRLI